MLRVCMPKTHSIESRSHFAAIAQSVEQLTCNEKVQGSIPCGGTKVTCTFSRIVGQGVFKLYGVKSGVLRYS